MNGNAARFVRFGVSLVGLVALGWVLTGQAAKPSTHGVPLVTDWSHRHLIFSASKSGEQSAQVQQDPRFWQQWYRRNGQAVVSSAITEAAKWRMGKRGPLHRDWGVSLGLGGTVGAGNFPAKFAFRSDNADCTNDYVVFTTGLASSGTQASVVAFNNLYSGCTGTVPSVYWAYNTQGTALTSPVISDDGKQVAYVEADAFGAGNLVLIKWAPNPAASVSAPGAASGVNEPQYRACAAPCYTAVQLRNTGSFVNDTTSSVFYDYSHDVAWVGGDDGWLHKLTPVFKGANTPVEVHGSGFPAQVAPTAAFLSDPVYDSASQQVFVGDSNGFLYSVNALNGALHTKSGQLDFAGGIVEGPIVDTSNQRVYVFASNDGSSNVCDPTAACAAVYQFDTHFLNNTTGIEIPVGTSTVLPAAPSASYTGGFDNAYYSSVDGTGNLYVCGNTGGAPTIYQIPLVSGVPGSASALVRLTATNVTAGCSPVTDILNPSDPAGPTERIFVGITTNASAANCVILTVAGGCVQSFPVTPWRASNVYTAGQQILDSNLRVEVVLSGGTSDVVAPAWPGSPGVTTVDHSVTWVTQGGLQVAPDAWVASHTYGLDRILDSNGNLQVSIVGGTSGAGPLPPSWSLTLGGITVDGSVDWENIGPPTQASMPAPGGSSGIIIDNVVQTPTGASQVYFSTLSDQPICGVGTGGCAIQASQSGLN